MGEKLSFFEADMFFQLIGKLLQQAYIAFIFLDLGYQIFNDPMLSLGLPTQGITGVEGGKEQDFLGIKMFFQVHFEEEEAVGCYPLRTHAGFNSLPDLPNEQQSEMMVFGEGNDRGIALDGYGLFHGLMI